MTSRINTRRVRFTLLLVGLSFLLGLWVGTYVPEIMARFGEARVSDIEDAPSPAVSDVADDSAPKEPGRWTGEIPAEMAMDTETMREILALGYLAGSTPATPFQGVTQYDKERSFNGLNLYCSGHAEKAFLMDMEGNVLHTWQASFEEIAQGVDPGIFRGKDWWRRVHLDSNGDLLAIYEFLGLIKVDKESNFLWGNWTGCHHDIHVEEDKIYVLGRELKTVPWIDPERKVYEDYVLTLDHHGNELERVSILECFRNSKYRRTLTKVLTDNQPDVLHTNTLEILDGKLGNGAPPFLPGHALVSMLKTNSIGVINLEKKKFTWLLGAGTLWRWQHDPTPLDNGNLLVFANFGTYLGERRSSQILEMDPFSHKVKWSYEGQPPETFFTLSCGTCQRLPNGNTLITESDRGRAFEVTAEKDIVWEFYNPAQIEEEDSVLVATLFDMVRLPPDFADQWLAASP